MPESPQPPSPEETFKLGVAALKAKRYGAAAGLFSTLSQDSAAPETLRLKARMGWVKALAGDGQTPAAIAQCRTLLSGSQPQVKQWAQSTLDTLTKKIASPAANAPDLSGFQPLEEDQKPPTARAPLPQTADVTPVQPPERNLVSALGPDAAEAGYPPTSSPPHTEAEPPPDSLSAGGTASLAAGHSLFHYQQLNGDVTAPEAEEAPPAGGAPVPEPLPELPWQFPYGGRLKKLRLLPPIKGAQLRMWVAQVVTMGLLFWVCRAGVQWLLFRVASLIAPMRRFLPLPPGWQYREHTVLVFCTLAGLLLASPWLLDWLLARAYGQKRLSFQTLKRTHPEGCRLLRRVAQQRGWILPDMRILPGEAPVIFSYGWLPRYSRLVVSRGLLETLADDELATLIGYELAHLTHWTLPAMSLVATVLQLCHISYWQLAQWGDRQTNRTLKALAAGLSAIAYGLYWLLRKISIPLARARVLPSDRQAVEWTGNPNGLARALVKLEAGFAAAIVQAKCTPRLIESTDLLVPCSYQAALSRGSIYPNQAFLALYDWDLQNPFRHWLSCNSSHPLMGTRLRQLAKWSLRWRLPPEVLSPEVESQSVKSQGAALHHSRIAFLQQISPYIAPVAGLVTALLLWFAGGVLEPFGLWQLGWLYQDESVLQGGLLIGLGIGIMTRINRYFPDITAANRQQAPPLPPLLADPTALPTDSRPVRLTGTLLGRQGIANWLGQDFILQTPTGLLKLHFLSSLGAFGNLLLHPNHPSIWVGKPLEVQGWFRRGATGWVDIDSFLKAGKVVIRGNHPLWSTILGLGFCAAGLVRLFQG